jgi:hypothetical protein
MNRNGPDVPARPGNTHRLRALSGAAAQVSDRSHPWSAQEVAQTLALAEQLGSDQAASEQTGVSVHLISEWRRKAARDLKAARAEYLAAGGRGEDGAEVAPDWRTQRELEANRAGLDARIVRDVATQAMLDGNDRLARSGAVLYCALIDRAQLLTAGARPAPQTSEEKAERMRRVLEGWARRAEEQGNQAAAELFRTGLRQMGQPEAAS